MAWGFASPLYWPYEMTHAALNPSRAIADATRLDFNNPANPFLQTTIGKSVAAALRAVPAHDPSLQPARMGDQRDRRRRQVRAGSHRGAVGAAVLPASAFRSAVGFDHRPDPRVLIVAPMSGHYATLLRGTVQAMLPQHDVYITEWVDARMVPINEGPFDLDDYIDYLIAMMDSLGSDTHVIAVCQPSVPVLAAISSWKRMATTMRPNS